MEIVRITASELEDFMRLYSTIVWSDFPDWDNKSKEKWINEDYSVSFWKEAIDDNDFPVIVAIEDGQMVGYIAVEGIDFGVAYIGWIGVLNDHRGKGIATKLVAKLEEVCGAMNMHKMELETQLPELLPFFIKAGFTLEGVRKNSWQKLDNYMFGKSIDLL